MDSPAEPAKRQELMVGHNTHGRVVMDYPLQPLSPDGWAHILLAPDEARTLAKLLLIRADAAEVQIGKLIASHEVNVGDDLPFYVEVKQLLGKGHGRTPEEARASAYLCAELQANPVEGEIRE